MILYSLRPLNLILGNFVTNYSNTVIVDDLRLFTWTQIVFLTHFEVKETNNDFQVLININLLLLNLFLLINHT